MTPGAIEIVRFTVPPARRAELLAGHDPATRAIAAVAPGSRWARLARLDERTWLEIVVWGTVDEFERALDRAPSDPTAAAWFGLADPGWSIVTGSIEASTPGHPPVNGILELDWSADSVQTGSARWSCVARMDPRAWVDEAGWSEREPGTLVLTAYAEPPSGATGELAEVLDAVDVVPAAIAR